MSGSGYATTSGIYSGSAEYTGSLQEINPRFFDLMGRVPSRLTTGIRVDQSDAIAPPLGGRSTR